MGRGIIFILQMKKLKLSEARPLFGNPDSLTSNTYAFFIDNILNNTTCKLKFEIEMLVFIIILTFIPTPHSLDSVFFVSLVLCATLCNCRNYPQIKPESLLDCKQDLFEQW